MLFGELFLQEDAAPQHRGGAVGGDDGGGEHDMVLVGKGVDIEQLTDRFKAGGNVLRRLCADGKFFFSQQKIAEAAEPCRKKGQLIGNICRILVQRLQHQRIGKGSRCVQKAVGKRQKKRKRTFGILAIGLLLTAGAERVILSCLHDAQTDHTGADQRDRRQNRYGIFPNGGNTEKQNACRSDQCAGGIADGRGNRKLDIAQTDIAESHGKDVKQGNGEVSPQNFPRNFHADAENHICRVKSHDRADGSDHFQMRRAVFLAAAADFGKDIRTAPAEKGKDGTEKPAHVMPPEALPAPRLSASARKAGFPAWHGTMSDRPENRRHRAHGWDRRRKAQWTSPAQRHPLP